MSGVCQQQSRFHRDRNATKDRPWELTESLSASSYQITATLWKLLNILHSFLCCHSGCGIIVLISIEKITSVQPWRDCYWQFKKLFFPNVICLNRIASVRSAPPCFSPLLIPHFPVLCPRWYACYSTRRCVCSAHKFPVLKLHCSLDFCFVCFFLVWEFLFLILTPVWPLTHDLCAFGGGGPLN